MAPGDMQVSDLWSERAQAYRESAAHREGLDLDLIVEWAGPGSGRTALDVATGGGHVARRLREAGFDVVSTDSAPGMQPDVVCRAEDLPFADASFDVVACRVSAHHFEDIEAAVREMARVARGAVLVVDNLFISETAEEADLLRDPSHVRNYTEDEWRGFLGAAGLRVEAADAMDKPIGVEPWLARAGCEGEEADRVRDLLAGRIDGGWIRLPRIAFKAVK
jgi:SAM-dependent methyltransferase